MALASPAAGARLGARFDRTSVLSLVVGLALIYGVYAAVDWRFVRGLDFHVLVEYWQPLLRGAVTTVLITGTSLVVGLLVGVAIAVLLQLPIGPLRWLVVGYVELWRNTPLIVQLFWVHFSLPALTGISTTSLESGFLALTLQSSAYLADIARAGIQGVAKGQFEAGRALGLPARALWLDVVLPQALKIMIPAFANLALSFLNGSALLGLLQVGELMTVATKISDYSFKPIEVMTAVGVLYLLLNLAVGRLAVWLEIATRTPG